MNNSTQDNDIAYIYTLMQTYVEGGRSGDVETLRPIFHELATICGYVGPDLFAGPIEMFYDWHQANGSASGLRADPPEISIEGSAARGATVVVAAKRHQQLDPLVSELIWQCLRAAGAGRQDCSREREAK